MHRVGDHASNDPETRRRCVAPHDLDPPRLELLSEDGWCEVGGEWHEDEAGRQWPATLHPVTIWTQRLSDARRAQLAALREA
jgi:hypothetical protein